MENPTTSTAEDRTGLPPTHIVRWAPADYLGSKVRLRAMRTGDATLRFFYPELLNLLYTQGGYVSIADAAELMSLPPDEAARCSMICAELRSVVVTYRDGCEGDPVHLRPALVVLSNPRVLRELADQAQLRDRRAAGGSKGAKYGALGGRPKSLTSKPNGKQKPLEGGHGTPSGIGIGIGNGKSRTNDTASDVAAYWAKRAGVKPRSERVTELVLKRISARIKDGFTVEDLCAAVDAACASEFYVERGYHKQPDVVFRNAERVQSLLARRETARAHRAAEQPVATPEEAARVERRKQACKDNPRQKGETIEAYRGRIDAVLA